MGSGKDILPTLRSNGLMFGGMNYGDQCDYVQSSLYDLTMARAMLQSHRTTENRKSLKEVRSSGKILS